MSFWYLQKGHRTVVAALENEGDNTLCFGRMIKRTGSENVFHMHGTVGKSKRKILSQSRLPFEAQFFPAFIDTNDGTTVLGAKNAKKHPTKPWTWRQIVMRDVIIKRDGRLNKSSAESVPIGFKIRVL